MHRNTESTEAAEAVTEATRTISDVAKNNAAYAQRALSTTRAYLSDAPKLITGGAGDVEAMTKTFFGLQNAILATVPPVLDAAFGATKSVFAAYTTMAEQQQKIMLGAWKRTVDMAEEIAPAAR